MKGEYYTKPPPREKDSRPLRTGRSLRARPLIYTVALLTLSTITLSTLGQAPVRGETPQPELITPDTQEAIDAGLEYLAKRQIKNGDNRGAFGTTGYSGGVAVASLAGVAFMASGDPPGQGKYGQHVDRAVQFLMRNTQATGYVSAPGTNDRMYGHGFATLCMAEAHGMSNRQELRKKLELAVKLIVDTQSDQGGWRYMPQKQDADLSVTICQIMGLRAAAESGLSVPKETRRRAIDYVKKSQQTDGSFMYTIPSGHSTLALTAAGLVSFHSAGIYDTREVRKGLDWMIRFVPGGPDEAGARGHNYFYAHYYAVQAAWHGGGEYWAKWYPAIRNELLQRRNRADGSWSDPSVCSEYATAMACIILQMPNNYLPIFGE